MLDLEIKEQLKTVFAGLSGVVTLRVFESPHADHPALLDMLGELASVSDKIVVERQSGAAKPLPYFELIGSRNARKISFTGIPGGHEFSSLILSILYSDGKGKQPDAGFIKRIREIKGPIRLRTYISLSCENCPEVVQALNLMATLHPDFEHEMIDGGLVPQDIAELGIQGVPSVVHRDYLLHSGRAGLIDLVGKLEEAFGKESAAKTDQNLGAFDVVVIGGGPAGASAAIYTARKGLKTALVAERMGGQVQETKGIENLISVVYTEGPKLSAQLAEHVASYPVHTFENRRVSQITGEAEKRVQLESGEYVVIATGAKWRQLGVPGEKENIGQGVAFCAHCDGPFYKNKRVAVVGGGNSGVEAAIDLAGIAQGVTLLEFADQLKADGVLVEKLKNLPNVTTITNARTTRMLDDGKKIVGIEYLERSTDTLKRIDLDGIFVQIGLLPNSQFVKDQLKLTSFGEIVGDERGRTSVPGIYAAGDVTTVPFKQIVIAMGDGAKVALSVFEDRMRSSAP